MIKNIIDQLCNHEISRQEAVSQIRKITNGLRLRENIEAEVEEIGTRGDDVYLKVIIPFKARELCFNNERDKIKDGDKIDITLIP